MNSQYCGSAWCHSAAIFDSSKHAWWLRVRSAERQTWEVCDDLFLDHMEPHEPSRVLLSEPRPDRSCLSPLRLPYGRPSPRTPHTHMFSVLLSRSREMMRVAVPAVMACAADYRKSSVLCWSLIPSDGPVKAAGADKGSVCCSTGLLYHLNHPRAKLKGRLEPTPISVDQINSPICQDTDPTMAIKSLPCYPQQDYHVWQQVACELQSAAGQDGKTMFFCHPDDVQR